MAQQPTEQQSPTEKQHGGGQGHRHAAEAQSATNQGGAGKQHGGKNRQAASADQQTSPQTTGAQAQDQGRRQGRGGRRGKKADETSAGQTTGTDQTGAAATTGASPNAEQQTADQGGKGKRGRHGRRGENATAGPSVNPAAGAGATTSASPNVQAGQANAGGGRGGKRKLEQQKVQQIKQQHASFRAQPKPDKVQAVTFNQNYRIQGAEHWQGPQYQVFRSYHPEWHDEGWYHSHFPRVELIAGGYYYFNNGYWFPAWGYNPGAQYYAYDGPICVGHRAVPPDQVIADVQAALQEMGYYRGEVDGLVGPLTREALTAYQADQGLIQTAAIDEPTLDALGMG